METTITEHLRVRPRIGLLNKYIQKVQKVAVSSIDPIYAGSELQGFNVQVEGPPRHMSYLHRLIAADGSLKVG